MSYDCSKCPGYCCSYSIIQVTDFDIKRLAKFFGISFRRAKKKLTKLVDDGEDKLRSLRHQKDDVFQNICINFDTKARRCRVYKARPATCKGYPTGKTCGYWELLTFERNLQSDKQLIIPIHEIP